ncbi:MAG TPA: hypothetical protein EYG92_03220 [Lutibacter sp.]|nr:hypothetical protein [Lutibacter sp.]
MKKLNNYAMAILVMVFVGFFGCQKESLENEVLNNAKEKQIAQEKSEVEVIDGILHFRDVETFMKISEELMNKTIEDRILWSEEIDFVSLEMEIDRVTTEMEKAESKGDLMSLISFNQEILEDNDDIIEAIQPLVFYQSITNIKGYFFIGNTIYKIVQNKEFSLINGDIKQLNVEIEKFKKGIALTGFKENILYDKTIAVTKVNNGPNPANLYYKSSNYRVIKVKTTLVAHNFTNYSYMRVYVTSRTYKKSWGKYRPTRTWHKRKNFSLTHNQVPIGVETGPYSIPPIIWGSDTVYDITYRQKFTKVWTRYYNIGVVVYATGYGSYYIYQPYYINVVHGDFTCNAVGNHWVSY